MLISGNLKENKGILLVGILKYAKYIENQKQTIIHLLPYQFTFYLWWHVQIPSYIIITSKNLSAVEVNGRKLK